ncbi:WYL domain-containing protein [Sphingobium yanoikuyae]|jgi:hypothetical protein|uniref:WYL domain-containing protein n=1 Tax=Sphingobium yanoikuyae TaxID=13690 RepID=UPI0035C82DC3
MDLAGGVKYRSGMNRQELRPAKRARLAYLDQCFEWRGHANRSDLIDRFGISPAQAAADFRDYLDLCHEPLPSYDTVRKAYLTSTGHVGLPEGFEHPESAAVVAEGARERFEALPLPARHCPPVVMRRLYQAMEQGHRIEIDYVSMTTGERTTQWIAPARIGSDGERLHVRAWSYRHREWRDYLPVRVADTSSFAAETLPAPLPRDEQWETRIRIELRPRSDLTAEQQRAVRQEYGIDGDCLVVETNEALAFYVERRWGLILPEARLELRSTKKVGMHAGKDG